MRRIRAFTLIELLTVMAITGVLMTLIVVPLVQSFNLTRAGQAFADAQDKARLLTDRIAREIGNAVLVRGGGVGTVQSQINQTDIGTGTYTAAIIPTHAVVIRVPGKDGKIVEAVLPYSKLDLVPPAQGDPGNRDSSGAFFNPITGKYDPTLTRPMGDIRLPTAPGSTIVRWFIGLLDPNQPYNEPYSGGLMARGGGRDNLYVLYRAEVQPYNPDGTVNTKYFRADSTGRTIVDFDDPRFFIKDGLDANKNQRVEYWRQAAVVQTEISRYDMIRPLTVGSPATPTTVYNGNVPALVPMIQFRPTRVASAPAQGQVAARPGEAVEGLDRIGPDGYMTERGLLSNAIVRYYPSGGNSLAIAEVINGASGIWNGASTDNGLDTVAVGAGQTEYFDLTKYEATLATGTGYPFTAAATTDTTWTADDALRSNFTAFRVLTGPGKIVTSFPIEEVGTTALSDSRPNLPTLTVVSPAQSPTTDPNTDQPLSVMTPGYDVNRAFNHAWNAYPDLRGTLRRFIDLRFVPNEDGTLSPLCPIPANGQVRGFNSVAYANNTGLLNRVKITPNSEEVYAPDQNPGPNFGNIVRYTRVTGEPGPNQYRIVYADLPEPTNSTGDIDYSVIGLTSTELTGFDAKAYDPTNFVSAFIQPRFKAGYIEFDSDPNYPIPPPRVAGDPAIKVKYRFQFNGPGDTFAVDYDTREIMQVLLTIRNYPQSNLPNPQAVTLKSTATLRNVLR